MALEASEGRREKETVFDSFDRNPWPRRNRAGHGKEDLPDF